MVKRNRTRSYTMSVVILVALTFSWHAAGQIFGSAANDRTKPVKLITFGASHRTIMPPSVTVAPGRYMIRLKNAVTQNDVAFIISARDRSKSARVNVGRGQANGRSYFDLDPGEYEVTVEGFPNLKGKIAVKQ